MTPPTEGGDLPVDWWKKPVDGEPWSVTLDTGEVIVAGMRAVPYDPIIVPGDPDAPFIEYGPMVWTSLDDPLDDGEFG